jgi:hypothetical protein
LSLYIQPLVALTYTNVKATELVDTVKSEAEPKTLDPFLPIVKLLDARLFPLSINVTSSPTDGLAGKLIVTGAPIPPPDVSTNTWSPLTVVYVAPGVIYPFVIGPLLMLVPSEYKTILEPIGITTPKKILKCFY